MWLLKKKKLDYILSDKSYADLLAQKDESEHFHELTFSQLRDILYHASGRDYSKYGRKIGYCKLHSIV